MYNTASVLNTTELHTQNVEDGEFLHYVYLLHLKILDLTENPTYYAKE